MFGVDLFGDKVLKLGNLFCALLIKIGLFGVEDMVKPQKECFLCNAGGFILFNTGLPENNDGGFFALANLSTIGTDLLKRAIYTALIRVGRKYKAIGQIDLQSEYTESDYSQRRSPFTVLSFEKANFSQVTSQKFRV